MGLAALNGGCRGVVLPARGSRLNSYERNEEEDKRESEHAHHNEDHYLGASIDFHNTR